MKKFLSVTLLMVACTFAKAQPIAHYLLDGNANDASGNGFHGAAMGSPSVTIGHDGNKNGAYYFNGTNQYVRLGDILDSVWAAGQARFTITGWFKLNTLPGPGYCQFIAAKSAGGTGTYQWYVMVWDDATLRGVLHSTTSTANLGTAEWLSMKSNNAVATNSWYHFAFVVDGSLASSQRVKIYLDGVEGGLASSNGTLGTTSVNTDQEVTIGAGHAAANPLSANNQFNGAIDDIKIFNTALSKADISSLIGVQNAAERTPLFCLYPNPSSGLVNIQLSSPGIYRIAVTDMSGRQVWATLPCLTTSQLTLPPLPPGIYQVAVQGANGFSVQKLAMY